MALAAAALLLLLAVGPAAAQTTDYDANDNNLIEIDTPAKLNALRHDPDGDGVATNAGYTSVFASPATGQCPGGCTGYELTADLDLSTDYPTWTSIATYNATLNGNGYAIRGLNVNATGTADAGLFGTLDSSAVVRQLGIIAPRVRTGGAGGGLAGQTNNGSFIDASYVQGGAIVLTGSSVSIGGLVGTHEGHHPGQLRHRRPAQHRPVQQLQQHPHRRAGGVLQRRHRHRQLRRRAERDYRRRPAERGRAGGAGG